MLKRRFPILRALALAGAFVIAAAPIVRGAARGQESPDVPALLDRIGKEVSAFQTLKTDFIQEKHLAVFQNTVVLKGRILLQKPERIAWNVVSPVRYSVVIAGGSIRQWDEDTNKVQTISLSRNPILQNVMGQLTLWFSGQYSSLLKDFDVVVLQDSPLAFRFTPRKENMAAKIIRDIEITFRDDRKYLHSLSVHELGGDSTVITFMNTQFDVPLGERDFEVKQRV